MGRLPASPAHRPRGKCQPWALLDPGADQGGSPTPPGCHRAESCRDGGEALTSMERNWGEAQTETGAFCVILNFPEPRRCSPWLCMNFSDLTGWPEGRGGGGGGPHARRPLPTEARPLAPTSRLAQVTQTPALGHWRDQRLADFRPTPEHTQMIPALTDHKSGNTDTQTSGDSLTCECTQ